MTVQTGVICYPIVDGEMLLLRKTRGHGEGRVVGPGGKLEPGESPREAAVRETQEEVGVHVSDLERRGRLEFVFGGEPFMDCHVFRADAVKGTATASDEGVPEWHPTDDPPYEAMWDGDDRWLPHLIAGRTFEGTIRFDDDGENLLEATIDTDAPD